MKAPKQNPQRLKREAEALRENLGKRKQQERLRQRQMTEDSNQGSEKKK